MSILIGSARIGENGRITGGKPGDQKQTNSTKDKKGEVSMQEFYVHSKGWIILRPKSIKHSHNLAISMETACNNDNIGYNQDERYGVVKYGTKTKVKTNSDCSSLVRTCVKEATGKDPGDFTTEVEANMIMATGLFEKIEFVSLSKTPVYNGDILVTKTKGHTVIVCKGNPRPRNKENNTNYYPIYKDGGESIIEALSSVGEKDTSLEHRKAIGKKNNIDNVGTAEANLKMLDLLKKGKLIKA